MTKALLSQHGVEFDALDVENDSEVRRQFRAAGFLRTPVVVVGDRHLVGWNPSLLAELVGFDYKEPEPEPEELLGALRVVLDGSLRAV
ncbi:MAG: glutaredoxin family protein [Chloroflexota bacterium]|nr:glutaredoxin family protein [Chloroflexota bacterium]